MTATVTLTSTKAPQDKATRSVNVFHTVTRRLEGDLEQANVKIAQFAEKLVKDPDYTMRWADDAFAYAASVNVLKFALNFLKGDEAIKMTLTTPYGGLRALEVLRDHAQKELIRGARFPSRSTSFCTNEMAVCALAAWTEVLDRANDGIDWINAAEA